MGEIVAKSLFGSASIYHSGFCLSQLAELSRSEFDPELFSHSAYVFCDIRDKSALFEILRQDETIFDLGNG